MTKSNSKGLFITYCVLGTLYAFMMFFSASAKLQPHPDAVKIIHGVIGVPLGLFPVLAALEIAGGLGVIAGIFRPKLGVAGATGLVCYFVGALSAHALVGDYAGMGSPVTPLLLAILILWLRLKSSRAVGG